MKMANTEMTNERLSNLLEELQRQEANLEKLSNGKIGLLKTKLEIIETISKREADRLKEAKDAQQDGRKSLVLTWRDQICSEKEDVEAELKDAQQKQGKLDIEKRAEIEVAKSKIAAIKSLIGEDTIKELQPLKRSELLRNHVKEQMV